jgi:hypothetical protein
VRSSPPPFGEAPRWPISNTYDFQALLFYERLGYEQFAALEDYPPGHSRHFLKKRLL